jgi:Rhodopirellula transposase DDE domain
MEEKAWDHDPPPKRKWTPFGVLVLASASLWLYFTSSRETSDYWAAALRRWWESVRGGLGRIKRLVIYLDNGPNNSGTRTQWLRQLIAFCDWSGLTVRLVYYPPYHSKYNPIERCWSALEQKWGALLLNGWEAILHAALRMTWKKRHPEVERLEGDYGPGERWTRRGVKVIEARLQRSATLPKYDITIEPQQPSDRQED